MVPDEHRPSFPERVTLRSTPGFSRTLRTLAATTLGAVMLTSILAAPAALADEEMDTLIASMEEISQEASAKSEEVKQLESELADGQDHLDRLRERAEAARQRAQRAQAEERDFQRDVNDLAGAKYRTLQKDPVTTAVSAENPQNAIDRAAYLGALTRHTERAVEKLAETTAAVGREHTDASRMVAETNFRQSQLEKQYRILAAEQDDLQSRIREIEEKVATLDEAARLAWENKNNPVQPLLDAVAADGVVGAALSKLGSPYGWGATGPNQFDCSGLMVWAYQQQGRTIPRTSQAQLAGGTPVPIPELQPGDLVGYYPGVTHVGMYIGNGQLVHASDYGIPVQVVPVDSMPIVGAVRY